VHVAQAIRLPQNKDDTERMKLLRMALAECDMILETNERDLGALKIKIRALVQFDPSEPSRL
jgi:hypothetical protein